MKKKLGLMTHIIVYGVFGVGLVSLASLASSAPASATCTTDSTTGVVTCSESASATVHVAEACTMTATNNTPHTAEIANGLYSGGISEYSNGIGKTTLKVVCNDASGFSIYAVGYTNNEFGNTKLMTDASDANAPIINTGTYDSGDTSAWAMKVSPVTGTFAPTSDNSFNSFHNIPNVYTRVAYRTSGTDMNSDPSLATGSSVEATYAAYVSPNQPAGTYVGRVKYTLVHPASETPLQPQTTQAGQICYYPNGSNVEGTMGCQTITASATSATLLASNFNRDGYGFAGWSKTFDYSDAAGFLGPQEYIEFDAGTYTGTNNGLSLYAHWVKSEGSLQNWTCPDNATMPIGTVKALTDQRDNNTYAIAKLADGNCWMIENLRLEAEDTRSDANKALAQGYGTSTTYGNFSGLADAESTNFSNSTAANSLYYSGTQSGDATINIGTSNNPGYRMPRYNNWNNQSTSANRPQNPTFNSVTNSTTNAGMYSYGNYYTWHAAIADTTYNGSNNSSSDTTSLCPTGWRLPRGGQNTVAAGQNGDFYVLTTTLTGMAPNIANSGYAYYSGTVDGTDVGKLASDSLRNYPNNFLYSGFFDTSSADNRGSYGYYWSSTAVSNLSSYTLRLNSSSVNPGTGGSSKFYGSSIRCTASASS